MRVLVITSCTGLKAVTSDVALTSADFDDPGRLAMREAQLSELMRPAAIMYTGQQHLAAMRGVAAMRSVLGTDAVGVAIISAGYGVVDETHLVAPYDATFSGMSVSAIRRRGAELGVPLGARRLLPGYDIVFLLLGSDYLTALHPPLLAGNGQRLVYFAKPSETRVARDSVLVPAGKTQAAHYGAGLVALKGRMLELVGAAVVREGTQVLDQIRADPTPIAVTALLAREAQAK